MTFPPPLLLLLSLLLLLLHQTAAGHAPNSAPADMPVDFCSDGKGTLTRTTGECMCKQEGKEGCKGAGCECQYGMCWCHYKSKKDCACL